MNMPDVKPTRSELLILKKKIKLAKSGHSMLKKKRDGLIMEFFKALEKARNVRAELVEEYKSALHKMNTARAIESDLKLKSIALAVKDKPSMELETKNVMGVMVPKIKAGSVQKTLMERGYGFITSTAKTDEAAQAYEKLVERILAAAEHETVLKRLLEEIDKTKRKVNALEKITIPGLETDANHIRFRLEEMERDNFARLKHIKQALS
ncbi:V-type ATP synthase subunit D [Candidatus Woesearchaeota archaeon]|nr:V-type ATP synthase subunit D [Candidatus Woesearchaeota archaeon]